jgi:hypothetical protein
MSEEDVWQLIALNEDRRAQENPVPDNEGNAIAARALYQSQPKPSEPSF